MPILPTSSYTPQATFTNSGRTKQIYYNVRDYGAKGDNSTDDTIAIQNAINAATAGGIIYFPPGIYLVSATLTANVSGVVIMGSGSATGKEGYTAATASVIKASGFSNNSPIFIAGTNSALLNSVQIGIGIIGMNFELGNTVDGLYFFNIDQALTRDCYVNGAYCCAFWMGSPLTSSGVDSGRILACKAANTQNHTNTVLGYAITANAIMFGGGMYYGEIEASSCIANGANGIALGDVNNGPGSCKIIGCTADGAGATGNCYVIAGSNNQLVSSGTWGGPGRSSLLLGPGGNRATNAQIIGNILQGANVNNNQTNGNGAVIFNTNSRGVLVAYNQILSGGNPTAAIYESGVTDGVGARYENNIFSSTGITGPPAGSFATLVTLTTNGPSTARNNYGANPIGLYSQGNVTSSTTFNRLNGSIITATLTGDITATVTNGINTSDTLTLELTQDATGSRLATWPGNVKFAQGGFTLSTPANSVDSVTFAWDGTNWREIARALATVTNANLTGPITSSGNATAIASQTGTGTKFVVDTSPTLVTPNIGVAIATSLVAGSNSASNPLTLNAASGNTLATFQQAGSTHMTYSTTGSTDTFGFTGQNLAITGTVNTSIAAGQANAFAVGANGTTNPVLKVDASTASQATGVLLKGAAAAGGMAISVLSSGSNENLTINAKGSGTITLNGTATGGISLSQNVTITGNLTLGTAGNKLSITTGTNASAGTGTLTGGTVTISTTAVTANSLIFLTDATASLTNVGPLSVTAKSAGTSFTVQSTNVLDTSTFNWLIVN